MHGVWSWGFKTKENTNEDLEGVVREDCQARKLNKEDAMDRCKWRKVTKEVRWPGWAWAGECFFWYRPTWVVPDKWPLNGCCCCLSKLTSNDVSAKSRVLHHQTRRSFTININEKITSHICWTNTFPVPLSVSCTFLGYINTLHPLNYVRSSGLRKQIPQGYHSALLALWWIRSIWTKTKICKRDRETDKKPRTVLHFAQLHYTDPSQ